MTNQTLLFMVLDPQFLLALAPVAFLLIYIYRQDRLKPEPVGALLKAFLMGALAVPLTFVVLELMDLFGLGADFDEVTTASEALWVSFFGAAIPEEIAKFLILCWVVHKNIHFDERMDGIVYATAVALGFAAVENLLYVFGSEDWATVVVARGLLAVPGHFCDGVFMGYYFSLVYFSRQPRLKDKILVLVAPILAHGIYDSFCFLQDVSEVWQWVFAWLLIGFCVLLWKGSVKHIRALVAEDKRLMEEARLAEEASQLEAQSRVENKATDSRAENNV